MIIIVVFEIRIYQMMQSSSKDTQETKNETLGIISILTRKINVSVNQEVKKYESYGYIICM